MDGITYPVLIDRDHLLTELYAISNVPTVLWIDEENQIVRPNMPAVGTDTFVEFSGVSRGPHMDALRAWVREGVVPESAAEVEVDDLDDAEVDARLEYRLALHLMRAGDEESARAHFDAAGELAPHDFTIRRAAMPLTGRDPFGENFFTLWEEYKAAGSPYHGGVADK